MKALIHDDKVVDVKEQSYEVHPSMKWIDCPNDIRIGFSTVSLKHVKPSGASERHSKYKLHLV